VDLRSFFSLPVNCDQMSFSSATELGFVSGHDFSRAENELKKIGL